VAKFTMLPQQSQRSEKEKGNHCKVAFYDSTGKISDF
jgi:hypothetical protein